MANTSHTPNPPDKPVCPRCGGYIPNNETPGAYPGAISRSDNSTIVCSKCGTSEAMLQFAGEHLPTPDEWPVDDARSYTYGPDPRQR